MKISTKGRYALRMMLDMATHQGDGYVALKDIAQRQEISKKYLEQIVPMLGKSNILRTTRGYQGGYRLARAPQDYNEYLDGITLQDLLEQQTARAANDYVI